MKPTLYKHTSRSYYDLYNAFVAAYPNKPTWIFEEMSGLFDFISEIINRIATDILYPKTRESAYSFAELCDYTPIEADGATTTLTITLKSAMAKVLSTGYQVSGVSKATGQLTTYELTADGDSGGTDTITVAAKQKKGHENVLLFAIENKEEFYDYPIDGYKNIIRDSITLTIDGLGWTRVNNFDDSSSADRHFILIYQSEGKCRIGFGNGTLGKLPNVNSDVFGDFETTQGLIGAVEADTLTLNTGGDTDIDTIANLESSGGNNAEDISSIVRNAKANVRYKEIIWSQEDLESAARVASSSVQKAYGIPGVGEAEILIVPSGGGLPGAPLKATVKSSVEATTQFGKMPITVSDPNYEDVNIQAEYSLKSGFVEATVTNLLEFAMTLITSPIDNQVIDSYTDNGIDHCREFVINVIWAWAFTADENDALTYIIDQWISMLSARNYREFGQSLEVANIWVMGDSLEEYGVDEFDLKAPLINTPVDDDEIINTGVITITAV